jgi:hypothetical protein
MINNKVIIIALVILCLFMSFNSKYGKNAQIENYEPHDSLLAGTKKYIFNVDKPFDSGIRLCMKIHKDGTKECDGNCLEYGYTGDALCFPKNQPKVKRVRFEEHLPKKPFVGFH